VSTIACIVIASERRQALVDERVWPSVVAQGFDEALIVGDWIPRRNEREEYMCVEPLTRSTIDALVRRDVGALATTADVLVYLCDDHALGPDFLASLREVLDEDWDVIVPNRYCIRDDDATGTNVAIALNNGERDGYCGGHGGIFRRHVIQQRPWAAHSHTRYWDLRSSVAMRLAGARFVWHPRAGIAIEDIEPNAQPWK
jgi:hypothetical protein